VRLLVECGNSSIKLALNNKLSIGAVQSVDCVNKSSIQSNFSRTIKKILKNKQVEIVYISYVNKYAKDIVLKIIKKELVGVETKILNKRTFKNFKLRYNKPNTLGMDRFLNCVGAQSISIKKSFIVVDIGTATTIDVIDSKLTIIGGVIIPGPITSYQSLISSTSMIGNHSIRITKKILGNSTKESLSSGFTYGHYLMISSFVNLIKKKYKKPFKVIVTGGLSEIFRSFFPKNYLIDSKLTLKGMAYIVENTK